MSRRELPRLAVLITVVLLILVGCGDEQQPVVESLSQPPATESPKETDTAVAPAEPPTSDVNSSPETTSTAPPAVDGVVDDGEYERSQTIAGVVLHWTVANETLQMAMAAPCTGYVSVGFDPERRKEGGNYIIGYVDGDTVVVKDHVGTRGNLHEADSDLGGTNDILDYAGVEADGWTTLEFVIPLDSGDSLDQPLVQGEQHIILIAYQNERDDLISIHSRHGVARVEL